MRVAPTRVLQSRLWPALSVTSGNGGNLKSVLGSCSSATEFDIFHTIDVRRGDADFEGWTVDRKLEFLDELQHIVNETLLAGVTSVLRDVDYAYYTNLDWPKKARRDSKYGILFRGCFAHIIDVISDIENAYQPALRVTIEAGHKNAPNTERIYEWARTRLGPSRALSGLAFADKKRCLPIAAADLLAYSAWGQEVGQKPIGILKTPSKSDVSYRTNVARVDLNRDSLKSLHEQATGLV